jgi:two-component system cell cycle sensor histidine kinase/response regulator CckA
MNPLILNAFGWVTVAGIALGIGFQIGKRSSRAKQEGETTKPEKNSEANPENHQQFKKMELLGRFASGIAHDFNNLLTVIRGHTELISMQIAAPSPIALSLSELDIATKRASTLTSQLLAFSRKRAFEPRVLEPNFIIRSMLEMLKALLGDRCPLKLELSQGDIPIFIDQRHLEQVILNLALNARDSMPEGGIVTIRTFRQQQQVSSNMLRAATVIEVLDSGVGMDEATRSRAAEPFFTTKPDGQGTGLGLATVRELITAAGGELVINSEIGRGTRIQVVLPAAHKAQVEESKRSWSLEIKPGKEKILIVEDEGSVRRLAEIVLSRAGYTVSSAASAPEALSILIQNSLKPDLVISDVVMADCSGVELAEQIKRIYPEILILFMSALSDSVIQEYGNTAESVEFISKPFSAVELTQKVREVLDQGHTKEAHSVA